MAAPSHRLTAPLGLNLKRVDERIGVVKLQRKKISHSYGVKVQASSSTMPFASPQ